MLDISNKSFVFEFSFLCGKLRVDVLVVCMIEVTMFHVNQIMFVLLRGDMMVGDGLDRGMIMMLVYLLVNNRSYIFMLSGFNGFMGHPWSDLLMDGSLVMTRVFPREVLILNEQRPKHE